MCFLKWNEDMLIGVIEIDIQHRTLLDIINMLADVIETKSYGKTPDRILNEFDRFIRYHFNTEEEMMEKYNFIDKAHLKEHEEVLTKLDNLVDSGIPIKSRISKALKLAKELFLGHTLTADKRFGVYMQTLDEQNNMIVN